MNTMIIKDMEVNIELNGCITGVIGPSNSGKTTLAKKICNKVDNRDIFIDDVPIRTYDITFLKNNFVVCLDDNNFARDYVAEELYYYLDKLGYRVDEATRKIEEIAKYFKITKLLDSRIDMLYLEDKILVKVLSYLIINPKVFVLDNLISYLTKSHQNLLYKYIKEKNISFINIVTDANQLLYCDNVVVMNNYKGVLCGSVSSVLDGNSILPYMGIKLPFIVDLSQNLILYNVINKVYQDTGKLVNKLWK